MVCLAPRVPGEIVGPRRVSGVVVRPLNFTVRESETPLRLTPQGIGDGLERRAGVFGQRNRVRVRLAAASIAVRARAVIGFVKPQSRLVRCAPGAE